MLLPFLFSQIHGFKQFVNISRAHHDKNVAIAKLSLKVAKNSLKIPLISAISNGGRKTHRAYNARIRLSRGIDVCDHGNIGVTKGFRELTEKSRGS